MRKSFLLAAWCLAVTIHNAEAQSMSHEEEVVRNAYAKITLLSSLGVVTSAALDPHPDGTKDDQVTIQKNLTNDVPSFVLSDFQVGPTSDITQDKMSEWITESAGPDTQVIDGSASSTSFTVDGYQTSWVVYKVKWATIPDWKTELSQKMGDSLSIADMLHLGGQANWRGFIKTAPATYLRYAAYTVNATLNGKSSGPRKALFLFGVDAKGIPFVIPDDLLTESIISQGLVFPEDPTGLLLSPVRENQILRDWMTANIMPAESCSASSTKQYCCSKDRCGIAPVDFNQRLATSVPKAVMP
jgi:hypothetical protein